MSVPVEILEPICDNSQDDQWLVLDSIWELYEHEKGSNHAICKRCNLKRKCKGGNTTGLRSHGLGHKIRAKPKKTASKKPTEISQEDHLLNKLQSLKNLNKSNPLAAMVARMTACSGMPFLAFRTSTDLRDCIQARLNLLGFSQQLPLSEKTFRDLVMDYGQQVKQIVKEIIHSTVKSGKYLSIELDEWTSGRNRRYVNVTVLSDCKHWSLGLIRLNGSGTADKIWELVLEKLTEFEIDVSTSIVGVITDGAEVMRAMGRRTDKIHQLCIAHAIQLAVTDVFYIPKKKKKVQNVNTQNEDNTENSANESCDEHDSQASIDEPETEDASSEDDDDESDVFQTVAKYSNPEISNEELNDALTKLREVATFFKKSTSSNDILQKYVKHKFSDLAVEKPLMIDSKSRWNSMYTMVSRYVEIQECVDKALIDTKPSVYITPGEKHIYSAILGCLAPVMDTVKVLCDRKCTLLEARELLKLLVKELKKLTSPLEKRFCNRLKIRIQQRWGMAGEVLRYLTYGTYKDDDADSDSDSASDSDLPLSSSEDDNPCLSIDAIFKIPTKKEVRGYLISLLERMTPSCQISTSEDNIEVEEASSSHGPTKRKSFHDKILHVLNKVSKSKSKAAPKAHQPVNWKTALSKEMLELERSGERGDLLEKCYQMLITIRPTSVECERIFSAAGYLCRKIRSRLNDLTLNMLSFLRSFLNNGQSGGI